ncbi:MAG: hypothetical protein NT120_05245 [Candidatus Aenigmarchaeota archaeon]|nr:hypothetical protein [Candidatus Aenigmarchaeota archaeon]
MGEIYILPVNHGTAWINSKGGVDVRLNYHTSEPMTGRMKADPEVGIMTYDYLMKGSFAQVATPENPARSPSAGLLYVLDNGKFFSHRRDKKAPTHKLWHSLQIGYPACDRQTRFPEEVMIAEGSELVLVTKNSPHYLLVPKGDPVAIAINKELARNVGVDTSRVLEINFESQKGPDAIELYDSQGMISRTDGYVNMLWEEEMAINIDKICNIHFDPEDILPIDTEGTFRDGKYDHFNRETFLFDPEEVRGKKFGDHLETPTVYKSEMTENGRAAVLQTHHTFSSQMTIYRVLCIHWDCGREIGWNISGIFI